MMWQSTVKNKAHEHVLWHYPLSARQSPEENIANANELICGTTFVRDGVADDVCPGYGL